MTDRPQVVNVYLRDGRLKLLQRGDDGELRESSARPEWSLFTRAADLDKFERKLRTSSAIKFIRREGDYVRVGCAGWDVRDKLVKAGWFESHGVTETFEADLSPVKRWLVDSNCIVQKPIPGYFDLESDSRVPFARLGEGRVLCWGLIIKHEGQPNERIGGVLQADTDEAERELLLDFFFELCAVDQILAWNGDKFDFKLLAERIERLGLDIDMRRWLQLDHMELFAKFNITASESGDEKASLALNRVADSLGLQRETAKVEAGERAWEAWFAGGERRQRLLADCVEDAAQMERIEGVTGYVSILATLAETCGVLPDSYGMRGVNFVESFLMRLGAARGMRAPTKFRRDGDEQFAGAFVFASKKGLFRDVHVCDFARLYPSIMQAWNMSPETYAGPAVSDKLDGFGVPLKLELGDACARRAPGVAVCPRTLEQFRVDGPRGLFAAALDYVVEQRKYWSKKKASLTPGTPEWKEADRRDAAYKIIANTFYGVSGSPFSRYFLRELSESVTQIGVWLIQSTVEAAKKAQVPLDGKLVELVLNAVAGDTDSGFLRGCNEAEFSAFVEWCNTTLYPSLIAPTGADSKLISLAYEKMFSLMINVEKKCYAGRIKHFKGKVAADDAKPMVKGLEYKRGDTARLAREFQKQVVEQLLYIGKPVPEVYDMTPRALEQLVEHWQRFVVERQFDYRDAVVSKRMKKSAGEYGGTQPNGQKIPVPAHVQIAKLLEERGEPIYPGAKIEYVVIDGKASPQKCKPAADVGIGDLDVFYLWESLVWPAAERVLMAVWPAHPWKRWGSVRPLRKTLPGQGGFGFGERAAPPPVRH